MITIFGYIFNGISAARAKLFPPLSPRGYRFNQSLPALSLKGGPFKGGFGNGAIIAGFVAMAALLSYLLRKFGGRGSESVKIPRLFFALLAALEQPFYFQGYRTSKCEKKSLIPS